MVNLFELLEQLYKDEKLTYEQYNIIVAVCRHYVESIEEGVKQLQELEKDNAELKAQIERMKNFIYEDCPHEDCPYANTLDNEELKGQIEKMKNCANCENGYANGSGCMIRARNGICIEKDKWELAE